MYESKAKLIVEYSIITLLFFSLLACSYMDNNKARKGKEIIDDRVIQNDFFEKTKLQLPLTFTCDVESGTNIEKIDYLEIPENSFFIGSLFHLKDKLYAVFVIRGGDIGMPILYVYDKKGKIISSLNLYINGCISDDNGSIVNSVIIRKDYSILMIDSTKYCHYDSELLVDSIYLTKKEMKLGDSGFYEIANESKIRIK